jgi:transcriptional regulator with XRE-family HTH domain
MSVAKRLKDERNRLSLTQPEFGAIAGVGKTTVINWEKGSGSPDAQQLVALALCGVDVQYLVTGQRSEKIQFLTEQQQKDGYSVEFLTKEEQALLDNYRHAPEVGKKAVDAAIAAVAIPVRKKGPGI